MTKCKCKCYILFLSDSTTRPSDLPWNVFVQSGNSQAVKAKVVLQMAPPLLGDLGRNENRPRPLPLTPMLNPFFHKTGLSMHSLWLPGGLAPPCRVISNGRKSLKERHTASTEAYSVKIAPVQCNNSIRSLTETPF